MRKSKDELELARRFQADVRALYKKYPALTTPAAQRRLAEYLEAEMEKEHRMPPKGARALGEDREIVSIRLPRSIIAKVDAHVERLRTQHPYMPINRVHALSDLIRRACEAIAVEEDSTRVSKADQADPPHVDMLDADHAVIEEPHPPVAPQPVKAHRGGSRKKAGV